MSPTLAARTFSLPLDPPLETAAGTLTERRGIALRWRGPSATGVGEATPLDGWTESLAACRAALSRRARRSDEAPVDPSSIPADLPATRHGVQLAQADLAARTAGVPLATHLVDDADSSVPVAALIGSGSVDAARAAAERAVRAGYPAVKCKVGAAPLETDLERVRAVAATVGPDVELRTDANRAWTLSEARRALSDLADAGADLVEEPLQDPTPDRLAALGDAPVEIGLDETVCRDEISLAAWADAAEVVVLKPMACGGIDRAQALAERALGLDLDVIVSNTIDAVIARTAAAHLAAALPTDRPAGLDTADRLATDLAPDPLAVRDGRLRLPDAPGLGTLGPWDRSPGGAPDGAD